MRIQEDDAELFLKWAEVNHPDYKSVTSKYPLLSRYKRQQVYDREVLLSTLDPELREEIDGDTTSCQ